MPPLATVKHQPTLNHDSRPYNPTCMYRTRPQRPSLCFDPLTHLQTSILDLLINTRILPRFCIGLLHPKVLLVEGRLSCCPEPISRHGQPYTQDLVLWSSLRYDHSFHHLPQKTNPLRRYGTINTRSSANCLPLQLQEWLELPSLWTGRPEAQNSAGVSAGSYIVWHMISCE